MMNLLDQQLGSYRLIRLLGQGGFADVYLGEHVLLGTQAAIKVHHARMEGADLERFEQEARTIARLNHPHIVRVLDYGVQDGVAYLVMNYASGGTLRQRHAPGTVVELETVVQYVNQIASALQYAHDQMLVHRDVKPENMLIDADGQVLLSDFGIAIHARSTASLGTQDAIGTVSYMAPEQLRKKARPASDQYALAIIAYEWLTGAPPFDGLPIEVALQHITDPVPSLRDKIPTVPPGVERVLLRALAKEPEQRYPGIRAFAEALERAAQARDATYQTAPVDILTAEQTPRERFRVREIPRGLSRRSALKLGLAGGGILAIGIGGFAWLRDRLLPGIGVLSGIQSVVWSPGGRLYAVADTAGHVELRQVPATQQWRLTFPKVWALAWSPDNGQPQRVALACDDGKVRILDVLSGKQVLLYKEHGSASVLSVAWGAGLNDSPYIVSGDINGRIRVWNPDGGTTRVTVSQAAPVTGLAASNYQFVAAGTQPGGTYSLWDARAGGAYQFTNDNQGGPDTPYDSLNLQLTPGTLTAVAWSEDGNWATIGDAHGNIHFISDVSCSCFLHMSEFQAHQHQINAISWATTGLKFATASNDGTVQTWNVALENQSSAWTTVKAQHLQTFIADATVQTVAWSPDGSQLLYGDSAGNVGFLHVQ